MKPTLLVLAAGMASRYGSPKQIDSFGPSGERIIDYSVFDAIRAGFGKVVFVIRENLYEDFKQVFDAFSPYIEVDYAFQELTALPQGVSLPADRVKPWGTGHAVLVAKDKVHTPFAVINADDFYGAHAYQVISEYLQQLNAHEVGKQCMVGYKLENTLSEYGSVSRGVCQVDAQGHLQDITERTKIYRDADGQIVFEEQDGKHALAPDTIVSMNLMGFTPAAFEYFEREFALFLQHGALENPKSEFFLPSVMNTMIKEGAADVQVLTTDARWFGVTYKEDKQEAVGKLAGMTQAGVYPSPLWEKA